MNAPFRDPSERSIEELVEEHLARERAMRHGMRRSTDRLGAFLRTLARRRRLERVQRFRPFRRCGKARAARTSGSAYAENDACAYTESLASRREPRTARLRRRSMTGYAFRALAAIALLTIAPVATLFAANAIAPHAVNAALSAVVAELPWRNEEVAELALRDRCATARPVEDVHGRLFALAPAVDDACADVEIDHVSTPFPPETARLLVEAIGAVEGRSLIRDRRSIVGVLDVAVFKRAGEALLTGDRLTGSPPLLTAIESASARTDQLNLVEKAGSVLTAAIYTARELRSDEAREQFIIRNLPCVRGGRGSRFGPARAGGQCVRLMFGKAPDAWLTLGERCMLAGAVGFQIIHLGSVSRPEADEFARKRLKRAKTRARNCAGRIGVDAASIAGAKAFIDGYEPGEKIETFLKSLRRVSTEPAVQDAISVSPEAGRLRLTIDRDVQEAVTAAVRNRLPILDPRLAAGLCFRDAAECEPPDVVVAIGETVGAPASVEMRAVVSNRHGEFVRIRDEVRALGSVSKIPLSLLVGAGTHLCDHRFGKVRNPNGSLGVERCAGGAGAVAPETVFARSMNLPLLDLAIRKGDVAARLYESLGYRLVGATREKRALGMVFGGGATAPLSRHVAVLTALARGIDGEAARVDGVNLLDGVSETKVDLDAAVEALGLDPGSVMRAGALLRGVAKAGGTAPTLAATLAGFGCGNVIAKTGTGETGADARGVRTRALIAAFDCGDRSFVAAAMIGSPGDRDQSIGRISSAALVDLVASALREVIR